MAPSLPGFPGAPLKVDATTSMRWNKWGDQAGVELAAGGLKTLETQRMTTTKTMEFGDSSHRLPAQVTKGNRSDISTTGPPYSCNFRILGNEGAASGCWRDSSCFLQLVSLS